MSYLSLWSTLTESERFELTKIILDKGLLAAVIGLAGFIAAILIERLKSALKRREELSKVLVPKIVEALDLSETLFLAGSNTTEKLHALFLPYLQWSESLCQSTVTANDLTLSSYSTYDDVRRATVQIGSGSVSLIDYIRGSAPKPISDLIDSHADFFERAELYEEPGFFSNLRGVLAAGELRPSLGSAMLYGITRSVFVPFVTEPRKEYNEKLRSFRLFLMRYMPIETRRQKRAFGRITQTTKFMSDLIRDYPRNDFSKKGLTSSSLATCHGSLITQIRVLLRSA
jgi:hypothetical protein